MTRHSAIALALLVAGSAHAAEKKVDKSFTASPNGSLIVDADSASIHVSGADSNQITVHMLASGSEEDVATATLEASQKGDEVTVTMRTPGKKGWFGSSFHGDTRIDVTVPRRLAMNLRTSGGDVDLSDTGGSATLHTSGGNVVAKNFNGNLQAHTSGGEVHADNVRGDVDASTSGGNVRLLHIDGKIKGDTSGGDVECSLVGSNRGIIATTSGGSIRLILPRATTANVEAKTSGGGIKSGLPIAMTEMNEGHLRGTLNGGGQLIDARTSGGNISLQAAD